MGLGGKKDIIPYLQKIAPEAWIDTTRKAVTKTKATVTHVVVDLLLYAHHFAHKNLSYELLVKAIKNMFEDFFTAFSNMEALIVLLDESEYVPLGKIPTQASRSESFNKKERISLVNGGTLTDFNNGLRESIEELYGQEDDVIRGERTAFSKYYARYIRTRTLRKDLVRFIIRCLIDLLREQPYLGIIRRTVADENDVTGITREVINIERCIYFDGISISEYYADTVSDTPLTARKRTRDRSISTAMLPIEEVGPNKKSEKKMRICKVDCGEIIKLSDEPFAEVQDRVLSWLRTADGDAVIFRGYQSFLKRPDMGESDIKIPYYINRLAEMKSSAVADPAIRDECSILVGCWDTDSIIIILMCMLEMDKRGIPYAWDSRFNIFLDLRQKGSQNAISYYNKYQEEQSGRKKEIKIVDMNMLYRSLVGHFNVILPEVKNPIETFCMFCIIMGADYVSKPPGLGWDAWNPTFYTGGYLLLSKGIQMHCELDKKGGKYRHRIEIHYPSIEGFYNLSFRRKLNLGTIGRSLSTFSKDKRELEREIKKDKEKGDIDPESIARMQELVDNMKYYKLPKEITKRLTGTEYKRMGGGVKKRSRYFQAKAGIAEGEHMEWSMIMATLAMQRKEQHKKLEKKRAECPELTIKKKAHISDTENELEIRAYARRAGWYFAYICLSSFICMRQTKNLNCLASASMDNNKQEDPSMHGFKPEIIYIPVRDDKEGQEQEDMDLEENDKKEIEEMESLSLSHSSGECGNGNGECGLDTSALYDSMLASARDNKRRRMKRTVSYSNRVCSPRNIHIVIS
jgi:hypothetical protein